MGRVTTEALIENFGDLYLADQGTLKPREVRRVLVRDALADTGSTMLSMPRKLIKQLGLKKWGDRVVSTTVGPHSKGLFGPVRLTIQGRFCTMDVVEVPDSVPVLIGQIPLEHMDFVVDPRRRKLIGNPAHGGEHMFESF